MANGARTQAPVKAAGIHGRMGADKKVDDKVNKKAGEVGCGQDGRGWWANNMGVLR